MLKRSESVRVGLALFAAIALAGAGLTAQGIKGASQGNTAVQPIGSLQIDGLGGAAAIYGFGFEVTNPSSFPGGGGGAGKSTLTDVQVTRLPDLISPSLFRTGLLGTHLQTVRINLSGASKSAADSTYVLTNVLVSGLSSSDGLERVSFKFERIEMIVGGAQFCYEQTTNSSC
jgi:type VI protein secretion system component Hcp